jgi:hypothetical protein
MESIKPPGVDYVGLTLLYAASDSERTLIVRVLMKREKTRRNTISGAAD